LATGARVSIGGEVWKTKHNASRKTDGDPTAHATLRLTDGAVADIS
jgi:hypothetical protein